MKRIAKKITRKNLMKMQKLASATKKNIENDYMNKEGFAVVDIFIDDETEMFNYLSDETEINSDIYSYIDLEVYYLSASLPVKIVIHENCLELEEQQKIREVMQNHYKLLMCDKYIDLRSNTKETFALVLLGIALFFVYAWTSNFPLGFVAQEFIYIVATFAIWESVQHWLIDRRELRTEWRNVGQLATAEIEFKKIEPTENID